MEISVGVMKCSTIDITVNGQKYQVCYWDDAVRWIRVCRVLYVIDSESNVDSAGGEPDTDSDRFYDVPTIPDAYALLPAHVAKFIPLFRELCALSVATTASCA
jgi:hypothetical protein